MPKEKIALAFGVALEELNFWDAERVANAVRHFARLSADAVVRELPFILLFLLENSSMEYEVLEMLELLDVEKNGWTEDDNDRTVNESTSDELQRAKIVAWNQESFSKISNFQASAIATWIEHIVATRDVPFWRLSHAKAGIDYWHRRASDSR